MRLQSGTCRIIHPYFTVTVRVFNCHASKKFRQYGAHYRDHTSQTILLSRTVLGRINLALIQDLSVTVTHYSYSDSILVPKRIVLY